MMCLEDTWVCGGISFHPHARPPKAAAISVSHDLIPRKPSKSQSTTVDKPKEKKENRKPKQSTAELGFNQIIRKTMRGRRRRHEEEGLKRRWYRRPRRCRSPTHHGGPRRQRRRRWRDPRRRRKRRARRPIRGAGLAELPWRGGRSAARNGEAEQRQRRTREESGALHAAGRAQARQDRRRQRLGPAPAGAEATIATALAAAAAATAHAEAAALSRDGGECKRGRRHGKGQPSPK